MQELERRGARVACTYTGGLDFSVPVQEIRGGMRVFEGPFSALGSRVLDLWGCSRVSRSWDFRVWGV